MSLNWGGGKRFPADCASMLEEFAKAEDLDAGRVTAWTCALAPAALEDYSRVKTLARSVVAGNPESAPRVYTLGAILYRAGEYDEALKWFTEADKLMQESGEKQSVSLAYPWFFLAMTHHRLGNQAEAASWLKKATQWTDRVNESANSILNEFYGNWDRRVVSEILRKEAQALLNSSDTESDTSAPASDSSTDRLKVAREE